MNTKKIILSSLSFILISSSFGCATQGTINPTAPDLVKSQAVIKEIGPVAPKLRIRIKQAQIDVAETDLNNQINAILSISEEKRIADLKLSVVGNNVIKSDGYFLQKVPLSSKPLRIPFSVEGNLKLQPKNIIEFEISKVKVAGIPVKSLMDVLGIELANITKFKDSIGRIELKGNSFLFIVEKFSNEAIIDGQIKSIQTSDKTVTINF
ncbi:MAG: hypothetical protein U0354_08970 [Candidatus Sericytochromatia bacterium]